jgi:hypothetical protein
MKFNTISLSFGYAENKDLAPLIFQLKEIKFTSKIDCWNSFLQFLIAKFKFEINWESEIANQTLFCSCITNEKRNYCANCGKQQTRKQISYNQIQNWINDMVSKSHFQNNSEYFDFQDDCDTNFWTFSFSFSELIYPPIEIEKLGNIILVSEIYRFSKENDKEFFSTLNHQNYWDLDSDLQKDLVSWLT